MRFYRISFVGGLAVGYVLGAQAGRERYEQLKQIARKAAESPAMQQTAGALQAQATAQERVQGNHADFGSCADWHRQAQVDHISIDGLRQRGDAGNDGQ